MTGNEECDLILGHILLNPFALDLGSSERKYKTGLMNKDVSEENIRVKDEVDICLQQLAKGKSENDKLQENIDKLTDDLKNKEKDNSESREENAKLSQSNHHLKEQADQLREDLKRENEDKIWLQQFMLNKQV